MKSMAMTKNVYYTIIAVVLMVIAGIMYFKDDSSTLGVSRKAFAIADTASVTRIAIQNNGESLIFDRHGNHWLVNNKFQVKEKAIQALLSTLSNLEVMAPVPSKNREEVTTALLQNPITLTIMSNDKIIKKYHMTDGNNLPNGSYVMLDGQDKAYAVHLPGFEGRLAIFFNTDPFIWRDRMAFSYQPGEILSVDVLYPADKAASFVFYAINGNDLQVVSVGNKQVKKISKDVARSFLMSFSSVPFEWIFTDHLHTLSDSMAHANPYCEIKVKDIQNRINTLRTYRIPDPSEPGHFNINKLYAFQQDDSIPVVVKYVDIDPVLKSFASFQAE